MRILLTGSSGQLGRELQTTLAPLSHIIAPAREGCDLSSPPALRLLIRDAAPDIILNCAAYTDVNRAESQPALAFAVNATAPGILAEEAQRLGALLIHFSTDYVFAGDKSGAYSEADRTGPLNVYGRSKLAGEQAIEQAHCRYFIFRTSWIYSAQGHNFLRTMLRLGQERESLSIVDDQVGAPTSTLQLATALAQLLAEHGAGTEHTPYGLYHLTAAGAVSWCGFARRIFEQLREGMPERIGQRDSERQLPERIPKRDLEFAGQRTGQRDREPAGALNAERAPEREAMRVRQVHPISSADYPTPALRPANSRLSNEKFRAAFGFAPGNWLDALDAVLAQIEQRKPAHAAS